MAYQGYVEEEKRRDRRQGAARLVCYLRRGHLDLVRQVRTDTKRTGLRNPRRYDEVLGVSSAPAKWCLELSLQVGESGKDGLRQLVGATGQGIRCRDAMPFLISLDGRINFALHHVLVVDRDGDDLRP